MDLFTCGFNSWMISWQQFDSASLLFALTVAPYPQDLLNNKTSACTEQTVFFVCRFCHCACTQEFLFLCFMSFIQNWWQFVRLTKISWDFRVGIGTVTPDPEAGRNVAPITVRIVTPSPDENLNHHFSIPIQHFGKFCSFRPIFAL